MCSYLSQTVDKTQLGRAGELALTLYALVSSGGQLALFSPVADDDHLDLVAGPLGGLPGLGLQLKTTDHLDGDGLVEAIASYPEGRVREDPAFLYSILLMQSVQIRTLWVVPSPDFNRLAYRYVIEGREKLEFRASPDQDDRFAAFRIEPLTVGPALLSRIQRALEPPDWLRAQRRPQVERVWLSR